MKKFLTTMTFLTLTILISCSGDDDNSSDGVQNITLSQENLRDQSDFRFSTFSIITVLDDDGSNLSDAQFQSEINGRWQGTTITFSGTNSAILRGGPFGNTNATYNYSISGSSLTLTASSEVLQFSNVVLKSDGSMNFDYTTIEEPSDTPMGEALITGTWSYN